MGKKSDRASKRFIYFAACTIITPWLLCGCSSFLAKSAFKDATNYFQQGSYQAALKTYEQIINKYPSMGDRVLFEMGMIYAHPDNRRKDHQKALECFHKLIKEYPESPYGPPSDVMISSIHNAVARDKYVSAQQTQIEALKQTLHSHDTERIALQNMIEGLEQEFKGKVILIPHGSVDKILIEKGQRRLTLLSKGKALKTYKIALGGNPDGPKEMQGDNKTPEGTYFIESRNKGSQYHLSMRISYPNEKDKKRAKQRGVSPGGDIMIHGMKKDLAWVGDLHTQRDWTQGCIAVTDREIEEIERLVPDGTTVEIRP